MNVDGNVTYFLISNNVVHDNDNIGIDAIGFEGVGPTGSDQARYGEVVGNTVYNISGINNAGEGRLLRRRRPLLRWLLIRRLRAQHRLQLRLCLGSSQRAPRTRLQLRDHPQQSLLQLKCGRRNLRRICQQSRWQRSRCSREQHALYNNNVKNQGAEFQIQYSLRLAVRKHLREQHRLRRHAECLDLQLRKGELYLSRTTSNLELEPLLLDHADTSPVRSIDWLANRITPASRLINPARRRR